MRGEDLTGKKFGTLTVIKLEGKNKAGRTWLCQCDCGNTKHFNVGNLKRKDYRPTCGSCFDNLPDDLSDYSFSELPFNNRATDYTGFEFSQTKVLNVSHVDKSKKSQLIIWNCECKLCGNNFERSSSSLNHSIKNSKHTCCGCEYYKERSRESLLKEHFRRYKKGHNYRNKKKGLPDRKFEITFEYFKELVHKPCHYCGVSHSVYNFHGHQLEVNGIDRIDSSVDYLLDNIVTCCSICNKAKNDLPIDEWNSWLQRIITFQQNSH